MVPDVGSASRVPGVGTEDFPGLRLERAQRILGWEFLVSLMIAVLLPVVPATQSAAGDAGWVMVAALIPVALVTGIWLLRPGTHVSSAVHRGLIFMGIAMIALLIFTTGGTGSPYAVLYLLVVGPAGAHPGRPMVAIAGVTLIAILGPLAYDDADETAAIRLSLIWIMAVAFMSFVAYATREALGDRRELRAEADAAEGIAAKLRELDHAKDQFVSSATHELRTPLTVVLMNCDALLKGEFGELTAEQREACEVTLRSAERLRDSVSELLYLAQIDADAIILDRTRFSLDESLRQLADELRSVAEPRQIRIVRENGKRLWVDGDRARLERVFLNLLSNAVKYSHQGGEVRVRARQTGAEAVVEIADRGVGIPSDELSRIGERFFRSSTAGFTEGTGLGVAIARELLERHNGRMEFASRAGLGTTVRVRLPLADPAGQGPVSGA